MTQPLPVFTRYLSLTFNPGENPTKYRNLPVSTLNNETWVTIPWDTDNCDPDGMHYDAGGWTVLHGPCSFFLVAHVRLLNGQPGCSTHVQLVQVDPTQQLVVHEYEAPEWFVGAKETSHTHLMGAWPGVLNDAARLQIRVNYWNATGSATLAGASLSGFYGPLPA